MQYLLTSGSEGLSGVGFVYGIPILLIGLALKYAQLDPVPVEVSQGCCTSLTSLHDAAGT